MAILHEASQKGQTCILSTIPIAMVIKIGGKLPKREFSLEYKAAASSVIEWSLALFPRSPLLCSCNELDLPIRESARPFVGRSACTFGQVIENGHDRKTRAVVKTSARASRGVCCRKGSSPARRNSWNLSGTAGRWGPKNRISLKVLFAK